MNIAVTIKHFYILVKISILPILFLIHFSNIDMVSMQAKQDISISQSNSREKDVEKVVLLIETCPAWSEVARQDNKAREVILSHLEKIAKFDESTIRKALIKYVKANPPDKQGHIASMSRIVVLNRYFFNVPTLMPRNRIARFGGWYGLPYLECEMHWIWPLSIDSEGKLALTGTLISYNGLPYHALEEFDYFSKSFGLRDLSSKK